MLAVWGLPKSDKFPFFGNLLTSLSLFQLRCRVRFGSAEEERHAGIDGDTESVAERTQEESVPHQG